MQNRTLGIDLGTTYSCVAYLDKFGVPVVLKNSDGMNTTPSVVMIESKDNIVVGAEAKRAIPMEPEKTVSFIKRKIGREDDTEEVNGITYHASEISSYILKKLVKDANDDLRQRGEIGDNETITDVVITCPAYFGENERAATKEAGVLAGLNVLEIINEPTAAAINYGVLSNSGPETVLVYDLGGGTFDITIINIDANHNIEVICTGGDDMLGGKDWDEALIQHIVERYQSEKGFDITEDPECIASLYNDVEEWKKSLTQREKTNVMVNSENGRLRFELTRDEFEKITYHLISRTKSLLDDLLKVSAEKGYPMSSINKILLVGGSSKMPQVARMLKENYGVEAMLSDPDEAVAKGAAVWAAYRLKKDEFLDRVANERGVDREDLEAEDILTNNLDEAFRKSPENQGMVIGNIAGSFSIKNVLSRTYGTAAYDENSVLRIYNMLMMNSQMPVREEMEFLTRENNQTSIRIEIFESISPEESMNIEDGTKIGEFTLKLGRPVPIHTPLVIILSIDNSGILHLYAEEKNLTHARVEGDIQLTHQLNEQEMREAKNRTDMAKIN